MKIIELPALIVAIGVLIDFATVKHRPIIFDRFYQWWIKLSAVNLSAVSERGIKWLSGAVDRGFGPKVFSIRSMFFGTLFVAGAILAVTSLPLVFSGSSGKTAIPMLVSVAVLVPGVVTFQTSRLLLHALANRVSFVRFLLFGLASFCVIEVAAIVSYASLGVLAAFLVKLGYNHHIALADAIPVSSVLLLLALGLVFAYLPVAILPAAFCIFVWISVVLLALSSKLAEWIRDFLKDRVELEWQTPFTAIATVISAFLVLILLLGDLISPRKILFSAISNQTDLDGGAAYVGSRVGAWVSLIPSENKPDVAKYYQEWSVGLIDFAHHGLPTREEFEKTLLTHLPNLVRQWSDSTKAKDQGGAHQ